MAVPKGCLASVVLPALPKAIGKPAQYIELHDMQAGYGMRKFHDICEIYAADCNYISTTY